jgi:hypothetical protein
LEIHKKEAMVNAWPNKRSVRLFLFGSALASQDPLDVDILLVYADAVRPEDAILIRSELVSRLGKLLLRRIHSVLLSDSEEAEIQLDDLPTFVRDDSGHTGVSGFVVTNPEITSSNKNEPQHFSRIRDSCDSTYSD